MLYHLGDKKPTLLGTQFIAPNASVVGDVTLGHNVSVWFNAVIRGDNDSILINEGSNIQESSVLHVDPGFPITIETNVTVGHMCMLHGCTIGQGSLIGINSVIMNGATIGEQCIIGAKTLIPENKQIPPRSLVVGSPGRIIRTLNDSQIAGLSKLAQSYIDKIKWYQRDFGEFNNG